MKNLDDFISLDILSFVLSGNRESQRFWLNFFMNIFDRSHLIQMHIEEWMNMIHTLVIPEVSIIKNKLYYCDRSSSVNLSYLETTMELMTRSTFTRKLPKLIRRACWWTLEEPFFCAIISQLNERKSQENLVESVSRPISYFMNRILWTPFCWVSRFQIVTKKFLFFIWNKKRKARYFEKGARENLYFIFYFSLWAMSWIIRSNVRMWKETVSVLK